MKRTRHINLIVFTLTPVPHQHERVWKILPANRFPPFAPLPLPLPFHSCIYLKLEHQIFTAFHSIRVMIPLVFPRRAVIAGKGAFPTGILKFDDAYLLLFTAIQTPAFDA
jgi:hypothetical protein